MSMIGLMILTHFIKHEKEMKDIKGGPNKEG